MKQKSLNATNIKAKKNLDSNFFIFVANVFDKIKNRIIKWTIFAQKKKFQLIEN